MVDCSSSRSGSIKGSSLIAPIGIAVDCKATLGITLHGPVRLKARLRCADARAFARVGLRAELECKWYGVSYNLGFTRVRCIGRIGRVTRIGHVGDITRIRRCRIIVV